LVADARWVVATSERERDELVECRVPGNKIVIRRNGIDLPERLPGRGAFRKQQGIAENAKVVLFLGRLVPMKSPDLLLRAFAGSVHSFSQPGAMLVIAGPEEGNGYSHELETLARQLALDKKVLFTGPLYGEVKWAAYRDADVFVLPSQSENFGNAAAEAVAAGTPVILTDRCGIAPLLDNRAGFMVPYDLAAVQAALTRVLEDDALRSKLREGCEEVALGFSWDEPTDLMESLYRGIIS
jgi:glycosyltransferase involved in cell wall biosynthesis